jgi:hypothetical protein
MSQENKDLQEVASVPQNPSDEQHSPLAPLQTLWLESPVAETPHDGGAQKPKYD